jgi:tRNA (guanine37-N1)-methyltransferase
LSLEVYVITAFPQIFKPVFETGVVGRAIAKGVCRLEMINLREYGIGKRMQIDDAPYGGGPGMVLKPEPIFRAVRDIFAGKKGDMDIVILLSASGVRLNQGLFVKFASLRRVVLICGRYEGVDERVAEYLADMEVSLGDFVLTGGEIPAFAIIDGTIRLLEGTLGDNESLRDESFVKGILDYPHYTRPSDFEGIKVPDVLISGNHGEISKFRLEKALEKTKINRPDLLESRKR